MIDTALLRQELTHCRVALEHLIYAEQRTTHTPFRDTKLAQALAIVSERLETENNLKVRLEAVGR